MNTIIERITEAIKDILIGLIKSSLDNMFTSVNEQVGTIAGQVGQTPQGWNAGIFNLIQNNDGILKAEMAIRIGKSEKTVQRLISSLIKKQVIEREGSNKSGSWKIKI